MKRKVVICFMTAAMMSSLVACGGNTTEQTTVTETAETVAEEAVEETVAEETTVESTSETEETGETQVVEGIARTAAMSNLEIQVEDGTVYFLPEADQVESSLTDGVLIGAPVKVTYTGNLEDGTAEAVAFDESSISLPFDREVYEFAINTIQSISFMDIDTFSTMLSYPSYMNQDAEGNGMEIASADDLKALAKEDVFTEDFSTLADFNLFQLEQAEAGYLVYMDDSHVGFTFSEVDGALGITGFSIFK